MSEYKNLKGFNLQCLSSDPSSPFLGQTWFNSTSGSLKASVIVAGSAAWTAGGAMGTARYRLAGAGASNTAALAFGGQFICACTESYNGTSWTAGGAMAIGRNRLAGAGTNTAALAFGGFCSPSVACTESYNGSSWTAGGALGTSRYQLAGAGASNTAALAFGGSAFGPPASDTARTESYNGTAWTTMVCMSTARKTLAGDGTNTAALAFGGFSGLGRGTIHCSTESYNISSPATCTRTITAS